MVFKILKALRADEITKDVSIDERIPGIDLQGTVVLGCLGDEEKPAKENENEQLK